MNSVPAVSAVQQRGRGLKVEEFVQVTELANDNSYANVSLADPKASNQPGLGPRQLMGQIWPTTFIFVLPVSQE